MFAAHTLYIFGTHAHKACLQAHLPTLNMVPTHAPPKTVVLICPKRAEVASRNNTHEVLTRKLLGTIIGHCWLTRSPQTAALP